MNNNGLIKTLIIILAVVCLGLAFLYAYNTLGGGENMLGGASDDVADYGSSSDGYGPDSAYDNVTVISGSDGTYTVTDDGTVEMDSIPNESPAPEVSGSDAE